MDLPGGVRQRSWHSAAGPGADLRTLLPVGYLADRRGNRPRIGNRPMDCPGAWRPGLRRQQSAGRRTLYGRAAPRQKVLAKSYFGFIESLSPWGRMILG